MTVQSDYVDTFSGGKKSKTSKCYCGLPSCICRCAKNNCPKNCRCMKCRRGRKSTRRKVKFGGIGVMDTQLAGRRRGRPCKSLKRKKTNKTRKLKKTRKMRR